MKKIAIIGCGRVQTGSDAQQTFAIGHSHAKGYRACGIDCELYGVDTSAENLEAFGGAFEVPPDRLFPSTEALYKALCPDAVSICTWPVLHAPMAIEAMQNGVKGVIIEKPVGVDVTDIRKVAWHADRRGAVVSVAHQRRYSPEFQTLRRMVTEGVLGTPMHFEGRVGDGWDLLSWTTHWFDMANYFFDADPLWVLAGMDVTDAQRYNHAVENASVVYAQYPHGHSATFVSGPSSVTDIRVHGPNGWAAIKGKEVEWCTRAGYTSIPRDPATHGGFAGLTRDLLLALDGGPEPLCSLRRSGVATEMAFAAQESARTCRKVELPLPTYFAPLNILQRAPLHQVHDQRTLLYADAHFGGGGREGLSEALAALTGIPPRLVDASQAPLTAGDLQDIDSLVLYHTQETPATATQAALSDWVKAGRPLLLVHAALGAWPDWSDYMRWCSLVWDPALSSHPHGDMTLAVLPDARFPPFREAWLPRDEIFTGLKTVVEPEVLIQASWEGKSYPMAWQHASHGHIGIWVPGHLQSSWRVPAMRMGLGYLWQHLL